MEDIVLIKGTHREMIMLKTEESDIFERAYFLIKANPSRIVEHDIMREANKLISEHCSDKKKRKEEKREKLRLALLFFMCGSAFGVFSLGMIWLISSLI